MTRFGRRDPLENPAEVIRRVYAYVAARVGPGELAEDVTSDVFERALRYRGSFDASKGEPIAWLIGIARRRLQEEYARPLPVPARDADAPTVEDHADDAVLRIALAAAIGTLGERDQELLSLRYAADLSARQIADLLSMRTNAVEVALHRALARLRAAVDQAPPAEQGRLRADPSENAV